jgi:hypothetical protein
MRGETKRRILVWRTPSSGTATTKHPKTMTKKKTPSKPKRSAKQKTGGGCPEATCSQLDGLCAWLADQAGEAVHERMMAGRKWAARAQAHGESLAYFRALDKVREIFAGIKRKPL